MKFCTSTLIDNSPDPMTGERLTTGNGSRPSSGRRTGHRQIRSLSGIAIENAGLPKDLNHDSVERFVGDVLLVLQSAYPSRVWNI